jgi:uncharacterized membrane protein YbaN (DUF454 family)
MIKNPVKYAWLALGLVAVGLGAVGAFLPLLPTTPLLLLAAYAFARSSERCHRWLLEHRVFGPIIDDWHRHRAIGRRSKVISTLSMLAVFALSFYMQLAAPILWLQAIVLTIAGAFVLTRPEPPPTNR